jgi:hypothetical protein
MPGILIHATKPTNIQRLKLRKFRGLAGVLFGGFNKELTDLHLHDQPEL